MDDDELESEFSVEELAPGPGPYRVGVVRGIGPRVDDQTDGTSIRAYLSKEGYPISLAVSGDWTTVEGALTDLAYEMALRTHRQNQVALSTHRQNTRLRDALKEARKELARLHAENLELKTTAKKSKKKPKE